MSELPPPPSRGKNDDEFNQELIEKGEERNRRILSE